MGISIVIPVYNEEKTVGSVVKAVVKSGLFDQVICVNDGSTDSSLKQLNKFGDSIILIDSKRNHGKGHAMYRGIMKAKHDLITFLDSDFPNLTKKNLEVLLDPVLNKGYRISIGYVVSKPFSKSFKNLSGQRVYYKEDLLPLLHDIKDSKYGVEVLLNKEFKKAKMKMVPLVGLLHLRKHEKRDILDALSEHVKELTEIAEEFGRRNIRLKSDKKILKKLGSATSFENLEEMINSIKDPDIRSFLNEYALEYIKSVRDWFKKNF